MMVRFDGEIRGRRFIRCLRNIISKLRVSLQVILLEKSVSLCGLEGTLCSQLEIESELSKSSTPTASTDVNYNQDRSCWRSAIQCESNSTWDQYGISQRGINYDAPAAVRWTRSASAEISAGLTHSAPVIVLE